MAPESPPRELDIRDYVRILRVRKLTIALTVIVVVGAALALTFVQTPIYEASTKVLLRPTGSGQVFGEGGGGSGEQDLANEIQILQSQVIKEAVREELGRGPDASFGQIDQTDVIVIRTRSTEPERARADANTYADVYLELRREQIVDELLAAGQEIQLKIDGLNQRLAELDGQVLGVPPEAREGVLAQQQADRSAISQQLGFYAQELDRLQVATNLSEQGGAQVLVEASLPSSPISPTPVRNALVALVVGLVLGLGLAFLREYLDDTVKTKDDLERASGGLTMIGLIPVVSAWKNRKEPFLVTMEQPRSPAAEAYRTLRTSLQFLSLERSTRSLQVTSATAVEGKTTTLANLAVTFARAGQRVIIVDCDLRRPRVHEFFGLGNETGFTSVLVGDAPLSEALQDVPGEPDLAVLASGPPPPNPAELLSSGRATEVFEALESHCDLVLVDSPPVIPVTDPLVIAGLVDATILIAASGSSRKKGLHRAVELLRQVEAPLVGTVLNEVDPTAGYMYDYGVSYGYRYSYYRHDDAAPKPAKNGARWRRKERKQESSEEDPSANGPGEKRGRWRRKKRSKQIETPADSPAHPGA